MKITETMNTYDIALFTIKNKEFEISLEMNDSKDEILFWVAKNNNVTVSAFNPLSLLALVEVFEKYDENWNSIETGNMYDEILNSEM
ncbi:hypothetical protein [Flavobacterium sp. MMS24-S5]|uniref:hypothetical protein n=1 Tax=Flavobacterium sp. MMS24-S5 TaxID=3416605 RepID=UPI003D014B1D